MADCNIAFTEATGQTSGGVFTILTVKGTVVGCGEWVLNPPDPPKIKPGKVLVSVSCGGTKITKSAVVLGNAVLGAPWFVSFTAADNLQSTGCNCGDTLRVEAVCEVPGPPGTVPQKICDPVNAQLPITCQADCVVNFTQNVGPCLEAPDPDAGKSPVSVTAVFVSPSAGPMSADLFVDMVLEDSGQQPNGPGVVILSFSGNLSPGSHVFLVDITAPPECSQVSPSISVTVPECGPTGACCLPDGTCQITTQADCQTKSGVYKGDGTTCANCGSTGEPTGACCLPTGGCITTTASNCADMGGNYKGNGSSCAECAPPGTPQNGGGCGSLLWAAVLLLAAGFICLALHLCPPVPQAQAALFAAGWLLIAAYGVMMFIWSLMKFMSKCPETMCEVAAIHMAILGPLAVVLGLASFFLICFWKPALQMLAVYTGIWGTVLAGCGLSKD